MRRHPEARTKEDSSLIDTTIAQPGQEPQTRIERGRKLYAEHGDQIWFSARVQAWIVPSENDFTSVYEVRLGREEECECRDFEIRHPEGGCKHIVAATLARAKTFRCEGCGDRFPNRERVEVMDGDHLIWFEGDPLCQDCAHLHGVL
jgi:hypothetical protein